MKQPLRNLIEAINQTIDGMEKFSISLKDFCDYHEIRNVADFEKAIQDGNPDEHER